MNYPTKPPGPTPPAMPMPPIVEPFHLVSYVASGETREAVREVMRDVNAGECIGAVMATMYRNREYKFTVCGEAERSRTFARGMVLDLLDQMRDER
jgi:hypothetical protein